MGPYMRRICIFAIFQTLLFVILILLYGRQLLTTTKLWPLSISCNSSDPSSCDQQIRSLKKSDAECVKYGFIPASSNVTYTSLPVYDFFIFNHEFDLLEIRLYELYDYVTLFLIAESRETLSGEEKPLHLKENWSKFSKYHEKMRRVEVQLTRNINEAWPNEHRMRNEGLRLALSHVKDTKYLLMTSDVDEIPKARFINTLFNCPIPKPFLPMVLDCDSYYYSYEFRNKNYKLFGPAISLIDDNLSELPSGNEIRNKRFGYKLLQSTCFHCSWCFNKLKEVHLKLTGYSHKEHNQAQFRTREHILNRYQNGKDLFDRPNEEFIYIQNNTDYPQLVKAQPKRFRFMTKRSKLPKAGFIDA